MQTNDDAGIIILRHFIPIKNELISISKRYTKRSVEELTNRKDIVVRRIWGRVRIEN